MMKDISRTAIGVVLVASSWVADARAKGPNGQTATSLAALPLADRCAIALMIAKEVRETAEVIRPAAEAIGTGRLRILISGTAEDQPPVSIFGAGEDCGTTRMPLSWTLGKYVDLEFAAGEVEKLPAGQYVLVPTRPATPFSWEAAWRVAQGYQSCGERHDKAPCGTTAPPLSGAAPPLLRLKIGWQGRGPDRELKVLDAVIELARFS